MHGVFARTKLIASTFARRTRALVFVKTRRAWALVLCPLQKPEYLSGADPCLRGLTDTFLCQQVRWPWWCFALALVPKQGLS